MTAKNYLAIDLGAESGRVVVGRFEGSRVTLNLVHRFTNRPVRAAGHLHWNVLGMLENIQTGLDLSARDWGEIASVGVDTWGVDFGLLDKNGALVGNPYHYRDHRTDGVMDRAFKRVPRKEIFHRTGTQFMKLNTLYQLYAMRLEDSPALESAHTLLMMPDLFNYWLTGVKSVEWTIATTMQCYDLRAGAWAAGLFEQLGLPAHILPQVIPPVTRIGALLPFMAERAGLGNTQVIAPASHDTGSAVAAIPARDEHYAYISSGTWSLMGVVTPKPIISDTVLACNFTNEGGVEGTIRLLKQIAGLWLVQECRRVWSRESGELGYDAISEMALRAQPFQAYVDPDDPAFVHPDDMPKAIQQFCVTTGQKPPSDNGALVRIVLEGLAFKYRMTLEQLEEVTGHRLDVIHIVGGGSQNQVLCQFTADACARPVFAGPVEATALGNVLAQALADRYCSSWDQARDIVRSTFPPKTFEPHETDAWSDAFVHFKRLVNENNLISRENRE